MLGVGGEARVADLEAARLLEKGGDGARGEELFVETHAEGFDPAEEEEGVEGGEGAARGVYGEG